MVYIIFARYMFHALYFIHLRIFDIYIEIDVYMYICICIFFSINYFCNLFPRVETPTYKYCYFLKKEKEIKNLIE